jgi:stage II sporulation protein AA (anti-sigma F factor antagonist)
MSVRINIKNKTIIAEIFGEIDHHTAPKMRSEIDTAVSESKPHILLLSFKNVKFMDSTGIGLVMGRFKHAGSLGCKTKIVDVPERFARIMKLSGLGKLGILN